MWTSNLSAYPHLAIRSIPRSCRPLIRLPRSHSAVEFARSKKFWREFRYSKSRNFSGARMLTAELQLSLELKDKAAEIVDALKGTSLFLVGMNGPIKTKVGKVLAEALRYCYFDSDEVVEQLVGGPEAAQNFRQIDEKGFLDAETEVLKQLSSMARLVVCAGDSSTQGATNLSNLRYGISIWIDIPVDVMAVEILKESAQFSNVEDPTDAFDEAVTELARRYDKMKGGSSTADVNVSLLRVASKLGHADLGDVTPEDIALEVLRAIEKLTRAKKMMEEAGRPF